MRKLIHSTTALGLVLSLSAPMPLAAQSSDLSVCAQESDAREFPCQLKNGAVMQSEMDVLTARLARQEEELRKALTEQARIQSDEVAGDEAEVAANLAKAQDRVDRTREFIAAEQAKLAEQNQAEQNQSEQDVATTEPAAEEQPKPAEEAAQPATEKTAQPAEKADKQQPATATDKEVTEAQEQKRAERQAARKAERRAARQAAAAAAATEQGADVEVESETLTEENVRTSDEEFETAVTGGGAEDDDSGMSKFEKALLLGLGAVAVGTILKNGDEVLSRSGDRVVVRRDGELRVLKDDDALLRQPGNEIQTERFDDGSTRTTVLKPGGERVVTIRGRDGTVLRRILVTSDGEEFTLVDDTQEEQEIVVSELPQIRETAQMAGERGEVELRAALEAEQGRTDARNFSLRQIREIGQVRAMAPQIELDAVRFETGSAAIQPEQARRLARVGNTLRDIIKRDPRTVILVEGHTDAVGDATYNLALSDRRAETVALALSEYFDVPAENMITQGYGESALKVPTESAEQANRRAVVRNITSLLR